MKSVVILGVGTGREVFSSGRRLGCATSDNGEVGVSLAASQPARSSVGGGDLVAGLGSRGLVAVRGVEGLASCASSAILSYDTQETTSGLSPCRLSDLCPVGKVTKCNRPNSVK